jgi:Glycosyl hydrolase family 59/Galactocerebrosidase, C-terminal lectin domain
VRHSRLVAVSVLLVASLAPVLSWSAQAGTPVALAKLDGSKVGRTFDGIGAISGGGGNSRLLIDYPEPQRSQILDALFKPGVGASLQILKVEIGADTNSTDGAESSIEPRPGTIDCDSGYEWWLMEAAKARNPEIKLYGLAWGAPGWVGGGRQTFFTRHAIGYLLSWLGCARKHGLKIDYLGGWNERGYDTAWYERLRSALDAAGYSAVKVVAADDGWAIADDLARHSTFARAVDVIGVHYPCSGGAGGDANSCRSPTAARRTGKPLWASESGSQSFITGSPAMARSISRGYLDGRLTAYINWPLVAALYPNLPYPTAGLLVANQPWSGTYSLGSQLWVAAHWAQFTDSGWTFVDSASGYLRGDAHNGTYVTLQASDRSDFSTIVETTTAKTAQWIRFAISGGLPTKTMHVWATNVTSPDPSTWFRRLEDIRPVDGSFKLVARPGYLYTLTTTTGQRGHTASSGPGRIMSLPYADDFDGYDTGRAARYLSNMQGDFQIQPCGGHRGGRCVRQMATAKPVEWLHTVATPFAILGDWRWRDYRVAVDVLFDAHGAVQLIGHLGRQHGRSPEAIDGCYLHVRDTGAWAIVIKKGRRGRVTLAHGIARPLGLHRWHRLSLEFEGPVIRAAIDDRHLASVRDTSSAEGQIGIGTVGYQPDEFDNLSIT